MQLPTKTIIPFIIHRPAVPRRSPVSTAPLLTREAGRKSTLQLL